jgi:phosphatidylinositol 4-kinase
LLDIYGHIVHIDYGFLLGTGPGTWVFEKAPFKLTVLYPPPNRVVAPTRD